MILLRHLKAIEIIKMIFILNAADMKLLVLVAREIVTSHPHNHI